MVFRSDNYQEPYFYVLVILMLLPLFMTGCVIPFALPAPMFPKDPYKELLADLEDGEAVTRQQILKVFGTPWASAGEDNLVYITDKDSSLVIFGLAIVGPTGGDAALLGANTMSQRDFFVSFSFDKAGIMKRADTYADGGNHTHCFDSGVCLSRSTRNVPLMPKADDSEAKKFVAQNGNCVIYMYRNSYSEGATYKEYVDIQIAINTGGYFYPPTSFGASVPDGYFRWELPAGYTYKLIANFQAVHAYPFDTSSSHHNRAKVFTEFKCNSEELVFASLTVPSNRMKNAIWKFPTAVSAKESVMDSSLLAGPYVQEDRPMPNYTF